MYDCAATLRVMVRILVFGALWVVLLGLAIVVLRPTSRPSVTTREVLRPAPAAPPPQPGIKHPGWTVTRSYSAHHMMVVEIEADQPGQSRAIAAQIVEPVKDRYDEILIYIFSSPPGAHPERRIQWTPHGGYVEMVYDN